LFTINFKAEGAGELRFSPNPEDHPVFETAVNDAVTGDPRSLANSEIFFISSPTIQVVGAGEGEGTNALNPLDVNQDTIVSPIDALLVISHLNRYGAGAFSPTLAAASGQGVPKFFLDVNVDGLVTASDAKLVIDYLNVKAAAGASSVQAEGEGESDGDTALLVSGSTSSTSISSTASTSTTSSDDQTDYANSVDRVLIDDRFVTKTPASVTEPVDEHDDEEEEAEEDGFFAALGSN
jgi:hypothetical protein